MAKMTVEDKRKRIAELEATIRDAEAEIKEILEPKADVGSKKRAEFPPGFVLKEKVIEAIQTMGPSSKQGVTDFIALHYGVNPTDEQVQGSLSNLKAAEKLEIVGRGTYALKK